MKKYIAIIVAAIVVATGTAVITYNYSTFEQQNGGIHTNTQKHINDTKNSFSKEDSGESSIETEENIVGQVTRDNKKTSVDIVAVGDDLVSDSVLKICKQNNGKYNFSQIYSEMKEDFRAADIAIINQETMLGGTTYPYRGYPNFNTPASMAEAIKKAGFNIVQQASNHSMDTGIKGIKHDISVWEKYKDDIFMVGLNKSKKQYNKIPIYKKNGIKFAILNYTYGLNGYKLPRGSEYRINLMDNEHWNKVKSDIKKAEKIADFTIVLPHWGTEYVQPGPTQQQKKWAVMMTEAGADLIIGTHPHVIEKIEWIKAKNGRKALCYYSLGNYTSGQSEWKRMLGGMAKLTVVKKNNKAKIVKKTAGIVPIVTHYEFKNKIQKTYKLSEYTEKLAKRSSIQQYSKMSVKELNNLAKQIVGKWIIK